MYRIDGADVRAPDADPVVPAAIGADVQAITGLDGSLALATPEHRSPAPPPPAGVSVGPCSHYWGQATSRLFPNPYAPGAPLPWLICGYTPAQIDSAYGITQMRRAGLDGRGQTIAITGAFFSPTLRKDADSFSREFGLPRLDHRNYRELVAPGTRRYPRDPAETQSWYIEQALDVEWTHAVAPGARIVYVGAANDAGGLDQAINEVVDRHLANIVSDSWGLPESLAPRGESLAMNAVFEQAAAEGIGVYFASGDEGDNKAAAGRRSAGFPDSSPWVTSVGGTSLAIDAHGGYLWESGWGTTSTDWNGAGWSPAAPGAFMYGSGGGPSHVFAMPSYQVGAVPSAIATWKGAERRTEPDLAMDADPQTGVTFAQTYVLPNGRRRIIDSWIGGTSLASPLVAGVMALADQESGFAAWVHQSRPVRAARDAGAARRDGRPPVARRAPKRAPARRHDRHPAALARPRQLARGGARLGSRDRPRLAERAGLPGCATLTACAFAPCCQAPPRSSAHSVAPTSWWRARPSATTRPGVEALPVVTAARIDSETLASGQIDAAVRAAVLDGRPLYALDEDLIRSLAPDLVITQDLCHVCAVSSDEVGRVHSLDAEVLALDPRTLAEVAESVRIVARRLGVPERRGRGGGGHGGPHRRGRARRSRAPRRCGCSSPSGSTRPSPRGTGCPRWSRRRAASRCSAAPASRRTRPPGRPSPPPRPT